MPYSRKRKAPRLSYGTYQLAREIDALQSVERKQAALTKASGLAEKAASAAQSLMDKRILNAKELGITGRGRYGVKNFVGDMRTLGLNPYTHALGNMALGAAGDMLGIGLGKLRGRGAYGVGGANDLFSADDKDDIVISHSEFLQSITPSAEGFETQFSTVLNPGLQTFAPMLAQVAQFYEEYEFIQLVFEFRSTVVDGNDNAKGTLLMATQYNPTNPLFTDEVSMDNYAHSCATKVTDSLLHGVECEERATGQSRFEYVRTGNVPAGQDPKTYDLAVFQVATQGAAANLQLGRLYVHYKVRLSKLKLIPVVPIASLVYASRRSVGSTITSSALFGEGGSEVFYETNGVDNIFIEDNSVIWGPKFAAGRYHISFKLLFATAAAVTKTQPTLTNCTQVQDAELPAVNWFSKCPNDATSSVLHTFDIFIDIPGDQTSTCTWSWTLPAGASTTNCNCIVTQVTPDLTLPNII